MQSVFCGKSHVLYESTWTYLEQTWLESIRVFSRSSQIVIEVLIISTDYGELRIKNCGFAEIQLENCECE